MKAYYARIPRTGWFLRVPRWIYNLWPWCGVVEMPDNGTHRREAAAGDVEMQTRAESAASRSVQ